ASVYSTLGCQNSLTNRSPAKSTVYLPASSVCVAGLQVPARGCSMRTILTTAAALFLLVSGDALADWQEASSDHFVIYADEGEKEIRKYSDRLERYYS